VLKTGLGSGIGTGIGNPNRSVEKKSNPSVVQIEGDELQMGHERAEADGTQKEKKEGGRVGEGQRGTE